MQSITNYIKELGQYGTCTIVSRESVSGYHMISSTCTFKDKRIHYGRLRKFKARFCARGDIQMEVVYYFEKYAPVVSLTTVIFMLRLSINQGWATIQMDLSNGFSQDTLVEYFYLAFSYYFGSYDGDDWANMFIKINKILYWLVQAPLYWYNHMKGAFEARRFKPNPLDPCMFYEIFIIELIYVDGVLLFVTDQDNIDEVIKELEDSGLLLTV